MTSRALRIGVLIRDQLVEERIFDGATPVTFGQSLRCALSIPVDGAPRAHVLFGRDQGRWILRPAPGMEGRLGQRDKIDIVSATNDIPLERGARGKLRIGDATILFQEVAARPKTPRPQLPASVRGTFADRIDRRLAVIIGGSLAMHVGIAAWAWGTDRETSSMLESPVATYQQDVMDVRIPDFQITPILPTTQPGIAKPVAPSQTPRPIVQPAHVTVSAHTPPPRVDAAHLANLLTSTEGGVGTGGMNHRQPGVDLDKQLEEIRRNGGKVTIGDNEHRSRSDDSAHVADHRHDIGIADPMLTETPLPTHHEDVVRIRVFTTTTETTTTLTPDSVLERISTVYMAGLKRCYRKALVTDATLSGKVALSFTVDERGRVTDPEAAGITTEVDSCISSQMGAWHFSTPKDKSGNPTDVNFHIVLALQPS
jgi:hypothetical protein